MCYIKCLYSINTRRILYIYVILYVCLVRLTQTKSLCEYCLFRRIIILYGCDYYHCTSSERLPRCTGARQRYDNINASCITRLCVRVYGRTAWIGINYIIPFPRTIRCEIIHVNKFSCAVTRVSSDTTIIICVRRKNVQSGGE